MVTVRGLFGKRGPIRRRGYRRQIADRVAEVSTRIAPFSEADCPDCGFGVLRMVAYVPARLVVPESGAFQKWRPPTPPPGSLKCNRCHYLVRR